MNRFCNTWNYRLRGKQEPCFNHPEKMITDFSELTPKTQEPYDLNGRQIYISGPSQDGLFVCDRLTAGEQEYYDLGFLKNYSSWGTPKYDWVYKSMACNSFKKFRIDIYSPGRIAVKCTLPKYTWASAWLYASMNEGDFEKDLLPIDRPNKPRNYYFEIDLFETMMNPQRIVFTGHYGTQQDRKMKSSSILWKDDSKPHYSEVVWDGKGNWKWFLDTVLVHEAFIPQPYPAVYPYLLLTLGMWDDYPHIKYPVDFQIEWIKLNNIIILR